MNKVVRAIMGKRGMGPPTTPLERPMSSRVRAPKPTNEGFRGEIPGGDGYNSWGGSGVGAPEDALRPYVPKAVSFDVAAAARLAWSRAVVPGNMVGGGKVVVTVRLRVGGDGRRAGPLGDVNPPTGVDHSD